jgi:hypothetical protein
MRRSGSSARALGTFVPKLAGKSFEKYGFSIVMLLTEWRAIVGHELAEFSIPERLKWPRNVDAYAETPSGERGRPGATLMLRVDGPRAIDLQFQSAQIIERINAYFGYQAVTALRFVQAPVETRAKPAAACAIDRAAAIPPAAETAAECSPHGRTALQAALSRLEKSVMGDTERRDRHSIAS